MFVSLVSGCVSFSVFTSLVGVPVSIASSAVGLEKFAQSLQELKNISQLIRKKRQSMIK